MRLLPALRAHPRFSYFEAPPAELYRRIERALGPEAPTYASYNYLGAGVGSYVKSLHFDVALKLARPYFGRGKVIDFGCADGIFLPSLSRLFPSVIGIDRDPRFVDVARRVVRELGLANVTLVCNAGRELSDLAHEVGEHESDVVFLLETIEHVGTPGRLYESKLDFLEGLFSFVRRGGLIILSVPNMVGLPFLIQRVALAASGLRREEISARNFAKAVLLRRTDDLERGWTTDAHLGFNHQKLERHLRERFVVVAKRNLVFSLVYSVRRQ
jgi:2-polyprenyl-3-methyl-5-hydroxy-6-metoxy-1,4-benzoquinol methylase